MNRAKNNSVRVYPYNRISILKEKFQLNTRNHRKNLIIDGNRVFCGGLNIHDVNLKKYCPNLSEQYHDYHFSIQGPAATYFQSVFMQDWHYVTKEIENNIHYFPALPEKGNAMIRVIDSGPSSNFKVFSFTVAAAIYTAEKVITIITPYFFPEPEVLGALKTAALSGVRVEIIIPEINDHRFIQYAMDSLLPELLDYGIIVYKRQPPFIHSKAILIDKERAVLGSANLDYRSARLNYELSFEVIDTKIIEQLNATVIYEKQYSKRLLMSDCEQINSLKKIRNNFCSLFAPIL